MPSPFVSGNFWPDGGHQRGASSRPSRNGARQVQAEAAVAHVVSIGSCRAHDGNLISPSSWANNFTGRRRLGLCYSSPARGPPRATWAPTCLGGKVAKLPERSFDGKRGLNWQITPRAVIDGIAARGEEARRAVEAMLTMRKIDIAATEAARAGA